MGYTTSEKFLTTDQSIEKDGNLQELLIEPFQ